MYSREKEMYPHVAVWLQHQLTAAYHGRMISVHVTADIVLRHFLQQRGWHHFFPDYVTFDIRIDITALIFSETAASLAFVECKTKPIRLQDVSQLLGYSRVARPVIAYIVSPAGISDAMQTLLVTYRRFDVLEYDTGKQLCIATWNIQRNEIDYKTLLPPGRHTSRE